MLSKLKLMIKRRVCGVAATLPMSARWMREFRYLASRYDKVAGVEGDVVECGVGKGRTFLILAHLASEEGKFPRALWGFDSFHGFPPPSPEDSSPRNPKEGDWSNTSVSHVLSLIKDAGIKKEFIDGNIKLMPGFFHETLKKFPERPIVLLHIDADLYRSYKDALTALFPKVAKGGVVLFDEYREEKWPGATKAIDEYFSGSGYALQRDSISGKYYLVK